MVKKFIVLIAIIFCISTLLNNAWAQKLKGDMSWGIAETTKFDKILSQKNQSEFIGVITEKV